MFSFCHVPEQSVSWSGALHTSGMLIFTSAALFLLFLCVTATQQMPLDLLALVARAGAYVSVGLWQLERWFLAGYYTQGTEQTVD